MVSRRARVESSYAGGSEFVKLAGSFPKHSRYNAGYEVSLSRRNDAAGAGGPTAYAACRVCIDAAIDGLRRLLLRDSRRERPGPGACLAASIRTQARLVALRVLLGVGVGSVIAEHRWGDDAPGASGTIAFAPGSPLDRDRDRLAPADPRTSRRFLIR